MTASSGAGLGGAPVRRREDWIDVARGIGIILVVFGHALRGVIVSGNLPPSDATRWIDAAIYSFHMPLFFILAGINMRGGAAHGRAGAIARKFAPIIYPYLLWSLIQGGLSIAAADEVNVPVGWAQLLAIPLWPIGQFWFLYALFVCQLIVIAVGCETKARRWALTALALVAAVFTGTFYVSVYAVMALAWLAHVVIGIWLGPLLRDGAVSLPRAAVVAVMIAGWVAFASLLPLHVRHLDAPGWWPLNYAIAAAGSFGAIAVSLLIAGRARWLRLLGQASLAIFVAHTIASAGTRIILTHTIGPIEPVTLLAVVTAAGLIAPLLAWLVVARLGVTTWVGFGRAPNLTVCAHRALC